jgi:alkylhydroperoxidase family enzyme
MEAVLADYRSAPIPERLRATLTFLEKLTLTPTEVGPADIGPMRDAGATDEAIAQAIYVAGLFNVIDRLADALDFEVPRPEHGPRTVLILTKLGYAAAAVLPG